LITPRYFSIYYSENSGSEVTEGYYIICYVVRFLIDIENGIEYLYAWLDKHPDVSIEVCRSSRVDQ